MMKFSTKLTYINKPMKLILHMVLPHPTMNLSIKHLIINQLFIILTKATQFRSSKNLIIREPIHKCIMTLLLINSISGNSCNT